MTSIFNRVYSYREREKKNNRENFLTEILAFCLQLDRRFRDDFFKLINHPISESLNVITQKTFSEGIPDIVLIDQKIKSFLLIESKIEHHERANQLDDYKKILQNNHHNYRKHLVYITKYYDSNHSKIPVQDKIYFTALKWVNIYSLINSDNSEITQQLQQYLKEEEMNDTKNFNYNDLMAMITIPKTISKMDEVFSHIKPTYMKHLGSFPATSRGTKLPYSWYGLSDERTFKSYRYWINTGFRWFYEDETIYVGIRIWISNESIEFIDTLKSNLETVEDSGETTTSWVHYSDDKGVVIENYRYLTDFMSTEVDQLPSIATYLNNTLQELAALPVQ
ncbi:PD-(D/E)XK nuclease family protein [Marivirga arenosa]|uniref:PD-(D/E)XK nuclease family protein n=1 Tax=Marivirga arenosa TaxID=3059076 RepID=A0AA51N6K5_9BACT|nr:PD-(D/E)XK nuclease family protein [Marivirga sp. ABR2-2]WMN06899.1 PD-(D/E)XK nuclease family protein [Marivirga sp. ABR2-2]